MKLSARRVGVLLEWTTERWMIRSRLLFAEMVRDAEDSSCEDDTRDVHHTRYQPGPANSTYSRRDCPEYRKYTPEFLEYRNTKVHWNTEKIRY